MNRDTLYEAILQGLIKSKGWALPQASPGIRQRDLLPGHVQQRRIDEAAEKREVRDRKRLIDHKKCIANYHPLHRRD